MAVTTTPSAPPTTLLSPNNRTPNRAPPQPNVANVVLGNLPIKPWYPSFYPEDLLGGRKTERLYVCQWCFRYSSEIMKYCAHCKVCPLKDEAPPGRVIYEKDEYVIHEVDGEEHKLYAQNLSLLSKLWLDTKSVFFDVSTFLYYPLILRPKSPSKNNPTTTNPKPYGQVVGFFSKEKMSWDNNNLACILVFPPWQKRGLGQILIAASYHLGRREGRFGGPERPLSALGRKGYSGFWCGEVWRYLLGLDDAGVVEPGKKVTTSKVKEPVSVTVEEISRETFILAEDVVAALREMDCLERRPEMAGVKGVVVVSGSRLRDWGQMQNISKEPIVDVDAFVDEEVEEDESEMEE